MIVVVLSMLCQPGSMACLPNPASGASCTFAPTFEAPALAFFEACPSMALSGR